MKRTQDEDLGIPIMPMIDIVFLLIVFFVVTASIEKEAVDETIQLATSYHVAPPPSVDPRTITVNVKYVNDDRVITAIASQFLGLEHLGAVLRNARARYGDSIPVVIRADGRVKYEHIDKIVEVVGRAGLYRVSLAARDRGSHRN